MRTADHTPEPAIQARRVVDENPEEVMQTSGKSVPPFHLSALRGNVNEENSTPKQLSSINGNKIAFSEKPSHTNLAPSTLVPTCILDNSSAEPDTNAEALTTIPAVTTEGSENIFQSASVFSMPEDGTILAVPTENFDPVMTACSTSRTGQLMETSPKITERPEISFDQHQPSFKDTEEPKKRRGGWPKGRKRKKDCIDLNKPKAPMAGYVRFLNSRRSSVKAQHPSISTLQVTKLIGAEWNAMSAAEKQVYHDEAEDDKKRYLEELVAYQQSEAYQAFLKRQQSRKLKDLGVENLEELDPNFLAGTYVETEDSPELYCKVCNQRFSSDHNKKEHMLGRQHLQMVTQEFEKEAHALSKSKSAVPGTQVESVEKQQSDHEDESDMTDRTKLTTLSDVMETLIQHNYDREVEIRELRGNLSDYENQRMLLTKELDRLKKLVFQAQESLESSKRFGSTLSNQLEDLRMVPSLFHVFL